MQIIGDPISTVEVKVLRSQAHVYATSFPGFSPTHPRERGRERPWKTLVMWLQNKINSEGGVLCLTFFVSGLFATFTQWSQQQDRFANPTTTITETKGNFCLKQTIR